MSFLQRLGFADILLWLLTFAVVYGILSQIKVPKSREAQAIIAIVIGFLVLLSVPTSLVAFISQASTSLILIALGILMIMVFLEVAGLTQEYPEIRDGKPTGRTIKISIFTRHPYIFGIIMAIIAILIFVGAGGLNVLGWKVPTGYSLTGIIFFVLIIMAIMWMIFSREGEKK